MRVSLGPILAITVLAGLAVESDAVGADRSVPQPYPTIQSAIDAAVDGDTVLVAPGSYVENLNFLGKAITVRSTDGPAVTTIDGGQAGSVVRFQSGEPPESSLEGFTLTNGIGRSNGSGLRFGGGIYCEASSPTIRGNIIRGNRADFGGGIYCWLESAPLIESNEILENQAIRDPGGGLGGGVLFEEGANAYLVDNTISDNATNFRGGGVACNFGSAPVVEGNRIVRNSASLGGGIACANGAAPLIVGNLVGENVASSAGGGISCEGVSLEIRANRICGNSAFAAGGVYCVAPPLSGIRIDGNEIVGNGALGNGGGIYITLPVSLPSARSVPIVLISNNLIAENRALFWGYVPTGGGGGIYAIDFPTIRIINCTIVRNAAANGSALSFFSNTSPWNVDPILPVIANTIIWGNRSWPQIASMGDGLHGTARNPRFLYSYVEKRPSCGGLDRGGGPWLADIDRLFVDPIQGDYHLRFGSPMVDAGSNDLVAGAGVDFEGDPRVVNGDEFPGGIVDVGADELVPEIAARFGTVNASRVSLANVLFVNGSAGGRRRVVTVSMFDPLEVSLAAPPAGPTPAAFALYAWAGEPEKSTLTVQPHHLGVTGFPTPLQGSPPQPGVIWNNLGYFGRLGVASHPSSPAPSILFSKIARVPLTVTLQGFIQDDGSAADGPVSVTNAVVLKVE